MVLLKTAISDEVLVCQELISLSSAILDRKEVKDNPRCVFNHKPSHLLMGKNIPVLFSKRA
jgi:hypothetical protein